MSEEKIDNLLPNQETTDGNITPTSHNEIDENQALDLASSHNESETIEQTTIADVAEPIEDIQDTNVDEIENATANNDEVEAKIENVVELTDEQVADDTLQFEDDTHIAMNVINNANAEEGEDDSVSARHEIPQQDYEALSMEQLVEALSTLASTEKILSVKDHVEEIRKAFLSKYNHFIEDKKDDFFANNPDTTEEFSYDFPLKSQFDQIYNQYRNQKNSYFKTLQNNLQANLKKRMELVEELKTLVNNPTGNIATALKQLTEIREKWKNAGPIPKDKYNLVWNNYHFHIENFYDFLHLDRDARDQEFKNNLEQKQRIISRAKELINENDINKSFRELQNLHRVWKEEVGPVAREQREQVWKEFSEITKQLHDKREEYFQRFKDIENKNLEVKQEIIAQIEQLAQEKPENHNSWQALIEKVDALRNQFFSTGKVPADVNENTWTAFKNAVRNFNVNKNNFYKEIKREQNENLAKKEDLVARAKALQENDDFANTTPLMKQIQEEWKLIGHVPRRYSDKLWKEFKNACNHYFDRLKESRKEIDAVETEAFEKKRDYLESLKSFDLVGNHKEDLDAIKAHIENWKSFGRVPFNKRHIEGKFNKVLDTLFEKLSSSKKEGEMFRYANKLENLASADDKRKIDNEKMFILKKVDEIQKEIFQLENNIQFFSNATDNNPMLKEIRKNIERHKDELQVWKDKLKQINSLIKTE